MLCDKAKAMMKIQDFAAANNWSALDYLILDKRDNKLSFVMTYLQDGELWGAVIIDDKIVENGGTSCELATKYIAEYFREEVM